jgi:two-component system cell cycle sensor histidine kinase/response regulator CckA
MAGVPRLLTSTRTHVFVVLVLLFVALSFDILTPRGVIDWSFYILAVLLAMGIPDSRMLTFVAVVASVFTVVGVVLAPTGLPIWMSVISRSLALTLIWTAVSIAILWRRANEDLRKLQEAVDGSGEIVFMTDSTGIITFVNSTFTRIYGYTPEEVVGKVTPRILKSGRTPQDVYRTLWESILAKRSVQVEILNRTKDRQLLTIEVSASAIQDDRGKITGFLAIQRDTSERNRVQNALHASETHYRRLFESSQDGIAILDYETGSITDVNPFWIDFLGTPRQEVLGKPLWELAPFEGVDSSKLSLDKLRNMGVIRYDDLAIHARGSKSVEFVSKVYEVGDKRVIQCNIRDITSRKQAEEALRESEDRYRDLVEHSQDLICTHDLSGRLLSVNPEPTRILGYSQNELLSVSMRDFLVPEVREEFDAYLDKIASEGHARGLMRVLTRDGKERIWEYNNTLRTEGLVQPIVRGLARDITERVEAERALKKTQEQFLQAQKMEAVGRLAGGVAHDFNNILTIINGYADLLLERMPEGCVEHDQLQDIRKAGERAASLTQQLLAFSRKQVIQPTVLDLNLLVAGMEKMLQRLVGEDIIFVRKLSPSLGRIKAGAAQIDQVMMNLTVNARDAMPRGGTLTIETANLEFGEESAQTHPDVVPGNYVLLTVSDTGVGMDAETLQHIFEPFFTTKTLKKGTGLGLSTVFGIVRQSGGLLSVSSEPGQGTTFKIYFPRIDAPAQIAAGKAVDSTSGLGNETILLVEDEPGVRALAQEVLETKGYQVLAAGDAKEAESLSAGYPGTIQLLLTDVIMPGLNGKELADRLQHMRPNIKVIFMSGYTSEFISQQGILEPGISLIPKPFSPRDLLVKIRQTLDNL